jgi:cytoskeleton protein RodZ
MVEAESRSWEMVGEDEGRGSENSSAMANADIAEQEPVAPVETGSDQQPQLSRISIELQGTSWIEVKDASGVTQISKLLHAGTKRQIQGNPPFKVVVGNTPVVTLTVDGEQFDLEPYSRRNVAKFTLDPEALDAR